MYQWLPWGYPEATWGLPWAYLGLLWPWCLTLENENIASKMIFVVRHHWGNFGNAPVVSHPWKYKYSFENDFFSVRHHWGNFEKCPSGVTPLKQKYTSKIRFRCETPLGQYWKMPQWCLTLENDNIVSKMNFVVRHHWGNFGKRPSGVSPLKIQI